MEMNSNQNIHQIDNIALLHFIVAFMGQNVF